MRAELRDLLEQAGIEGAGALPWDALIVTRSSGSLIHPARAIDRNLPDRGFHFVVTGDRSPRYYCKARPALPGTARHRETVVLEAFAADPNSRPFVPQVWSSANERIELQVTRFLRSEPLDRFLRGYDRARQDAMLVEVLDAAASLSSAALARPDVFTGVAASRPIAQLAADAIIALPALGITPDVATDVRAIFEEAGSVRMVPQHGDFWPQNVLRSDDGTWCVIDLDNFGDVAAPVYDVAHMLRTFDDVSAGGSEPWISRVATPAYAATRALLRRELERWQLTPAQLGGCVLLYLADIAMRVYQRGAPELFWGRFRDEVPVAAAEIRRLGSVGAFGESLTTP